MQLRQIEVFYAVMITGSTVGASEYLHVTQPAVSTTLKRMQDELGLVLFQNVKGRLIPTPEANMLFRQIRAIHEDITQLQQTAKLLSLGQIGVIRVGVVPALGERVISSMIARFGAGEERPKISLDVLNTHELVHRLNVGRLDLCCVFGRHEKQNIETLKTYEVDLLAVGPESLLGGKRSITLEDMVRYPFAKMRPTDPIGHLIDENLQRAGLDAHTTIELRNCRAAIALAREGVSVGVADWFSIYDMGVRDIVAVPFSPRLTVSLSVVTRAGQAPSIAEKRFTGELCEAMDDFMLKMKEWRGQLG